ncbi:GNVR domain-containing protein [Enterobacter mori]
MLNGRAIYLQLLTRQQELNISRSSAIGNVRIIDAAVTQPEPIKPRKALIIVPGILLGLIFSSGFVLVHAAFKQGITSSEQLEVQDAGPGDTTALGMALKNASAQNEFPDSRWRHKTSNVPFLPIERPADIFYRSNARLRTSLHFTMTDVTNQIVVFIGPTQDCGKTLVSTALAALASQAGQRVPY